MTVYNADYKRQTHRFIFWRQCCSFALQIFVGALLSFHTNVGENRGFPPRLYLYGL